MRVCKCDTVRVISDYFNTNTNNDNTGLETLHKVTPIAIVLRIPKTLNLLSIDEESVF